jgi:hypothetical protein
MPTEKESLDYLGEFLIKNHKDRTLSTLEKSFAGQWKVKSLQEFQSFIKSLSTEQKEILFKGFEFIITGALHDLLFNLMEENHFTGRIKLLVDNHDAVKISDGLHGEQFSKDGWIEKFSKYKETDKI